MVVIFIYIYRETTTIARNIKYATNISKLRKQMFGEYIVIIYVYNLIIKTLQESQTHVTIIVRQERNFF